MTDFTLAIAGFKPYVGVMETEASALYHFAWDDENPDYNFKCRTQMPGSTIKTANPPAVIRYYPEMREKSGDYRVNLEVPVDWKPFVIALNGGDEQKFGYWTGPARAQFNKTGWPQFAYVGMCGNIIRVLDMDNLWVKFETLMSTELARVQGMTRASHPEFIHTFTCVGWHDATQTTKHIWSTGTPRGEVFYPLVTKEGFAYIPRRHVA